MNYKAQVVFSNDDFMHFGVKGMKWGVRKDKQTAGKQSSGNTKKTEARARLKKAIKIAAVSAVAAGATYAAIKYSQNSQNGKKTSSTSSRERQPVDDYNDWLHNPDRSIVDIAEEKAKSDLKLVEDWETKRKEFEKNYADLVAKNKKLREQHPTFETKEELQSFTNEVIKGNPEVKIKRYGETDKYYDPLTSTKAKTYTYDAAKMANNQKYKRLANVAKGIEESINEDARKKGADYVKSSEYAERTKMLDDFYKLLDNV